MPYYKYQCDNEDCLKLTEELLPISKYPGDSISCPDCGKQARQIIEAPGMVKIKFERNGRKATMTVLDNGRQFIKSATREKYEHDVGNKAAKDFKGYRTETVWANNVQKEVDRRKKEKEKKKC